MAVKPDPGTPEAVRNGCTCPADKYQPAKLKSVPQNDTINDWMAVRPYCPMHGWRNNVANKA